jgi:hypothetical protein
MFGEPENQFSLTRVALSMRGAQKEIAISSYAFNKSSARQTK